MIQRYRIAVCDWMILERQRLGAFPLAKEIGADGVEVEIAGRRVDLPTRGALLASATTAFALAVDASPDALVAWVHFDLRG